MYCKNCGNEVMDGAAFCTKCGFALNSGTRFCHNCGKEVANGAAACIHCGAMLQVVPHPQAKSKLIAGLLGIFLGCYGAHNFYLGHTNKGVTQLLVCLLGSCLVVGPLVAFIWGLVEGIQILTGSIKVDAKGIPLKD
jgi:TM2 domain-containing membrane protein YozV